jgi:hypothetical protein
MLTLAIIVKGDILSAKNEAININKIKARCITTSMELKILPQNLSSLSLCIRVFRAITIGAQRTPRKTQERSAIILLG